MKKSEIMEKIKNLKDDDDINELLKGTDVEETFKVEPTLDTFKEKVKSDKDFKAYLDSENDKHYSKALKTMKENGTWEKEFGTEITTKYPDLITDPTQKKLAELEAELAKERAASARKDLLSDAMKYASEKKLPTGFVEKFLGEDLDSTKANLDTLADDWSKEIETAVESKMKSNSYVPGQGADGKTMSIGASIAAKVNASKSAPSDTWAIK